MALWEDESLFGKDTVTDDLKDLMTTKLPVFQETIQLDKLWVYLRQYKVVNLNDQKRIKSKGAEPDQIEELINFLITSRMSKVHGFFKSLEESDQAQVTRAVGLPTEDYKDHEDEVDLTTCPEVPSHVPMEQDSGKQAA